MIVFECLDRNCFFLVAGHTNWRDFGVRIEIGLISVLKWKLPWFRMGDRN